MPKRRTLRRSLSKSMSRQLNHETLEKRELLAADLSDFKIPDTGDRVSYENLSLKSEYADTQASARALLESVEPGTDFRLVEVKHGLASSHARFERYVDGVPVYGSAASVHMGPDGEIQSLHLETKPDLIQFKSGPAIDFEQALDISKSANEVQATYGTPLTELVWYAQDDGTAVMAWETTVSSVEPAGDFHSIVDASTGDVLLKENLQKFATGTGNAYIPNPYQTQGSGANLNDANDATSAALDAQLISVTLQRLDDNTTTLNGDWVDLVTLNSPTLPDVDASDPNRNYNYTRDDARFEQVNIYHSIDSIQEYIHSLGFDDDTGVQNGIRDYPTLANAHWYTQDQSFYSTADDAIHFGDGGVDDGEDADIIAHEYGHAIQHNQNANWGGGEMGAMGEGFGDYLAASFYAADGDAAFQNANDACVGEWDATSYSGTNPPCLRRVDGSKIYPTDLVGQVHADGEIWSRALWDMRAAIGRTAADQLVLEHHFALPANATMPDAARAILLANNNLNGGANEAVIRQAFVDRGILQAGPVTPPPVGPTPTTSLIKSTEGGPRLLGVNPNADGLFIEDEINELQFSPSQLTFRFDGGQQLDPQTLANGIRITSSGEDNIFDGTETPITPGFIGFGDNDQTVIVRFAETLSDDRYRIEIFGEDDTSRGITAIRNINGDLFRTIDGDDYQAIDFDVEIGGKVIAVVQQPIDSLDGTSVRRDTDIDIYFDDLDLFRPGNTLGNPDFYQLIDTRETATIEDDQVIPPMDVIIVPSERKVTLVFDQSLENLVPGNDSTTFRLRIGDDADFQNIPVTPFTPGTEPGVAISDALDLSTAVLNAAVDGNWTLVVDQQIDNGSLRPLADNPGNNDEIGHRDIDPITAGGDERHHSDVGDSDNVITLQPYTFLRNQSYGVDAAGNPLFNQMNAEQEARFREILELFSAESGIQFYETENQGTQLIVGDLFVIDPTMTSGVGGTLGLAGNLNGGGTGVIIDFLDYPNSGDNEFGGGFFETAIHEVGHVLGLDHAYDLPGSIMGAPGVVDNVYPGLPDVAHLQFLHQPEALDVDLYQIDINDSGTLVAQTIAERLSNASLLDSRLTLYQETASGLEIKAANRDYFGSDAFIEFDVTPGTYFVSVAADGNDSTDIESGLTSAGGVSEGEYELRLEFKSATTIDVLTDADGSPLDGDRDGNPGGNYNYWFTAMNVADTIYVRKPDNATDVGGIGTLTDPLDNIDDAFAIAATKPQSVVRVLSNDGIDNDVTTQLDNQAYEIGFIPGINTTLVDGRDLIVPANTSLVIDAGAILKFRDARVSVGSDSDGVDRSGSAIQVLGTPQLPVYFTSYDDHTRGINANPNDNTPIPGNWGGIEIRNDVDLDQGRGSSENVGIFPNYINHAVIEYGGGSVSSAGRLIDPINLSEARIEASYNSIIDSANAAISADPNTFEHTTFFETRFQDASTSGNGFVTDYERIGPDLHGNFLQGNSTNGLFVRIDTLPGNQLEALEVTARFDDTDIVHVLNESLLINGQPGGPEQETVAPSSILGVGGTTGGNLAAGTYTYRYTFVDQFGNESIPSDPQSATVAADGAVLFTGIPAVSEDFVSRRLYRSSGGSFRLIAELNGSASVYVDRLAAPTAEAPTLDVLATKFRARPNAGLIIDPGLIVKSQGARIELGFGSTLIAEGTEDSGIVFTARADDRYGAGGTFDTNDDGFVGSGGIDPVQGEWSGIYASPTSLLSLDQTVLAYGGGISGVEGTTAAFNVIEVHQAQARVANSRIEFNAEGQGGQATTTREGRQPNSESIIHVNGSQPIFVGNTVVNNGDGNEANGAILSINVNSLDATRNEDTGRQTGEIGLYEIPPGNHGPIFRGNELDGNDINAIEVRGGLLHTESVWDDTDIVHVLRSDVVSTNLHISNGLRLESSATESLVVKLDNGAELLATGEALDIDDRVGGRIQVLGTPDHPVVMTSINDCTVGAGFTPDGRPMNDTVLSGACGIVTTDIPAVDIIVVMDESGSMGFVQQFSSQFILDLEQQFLNAGIGISIPNRYGIVGYGNGLDNGDNEGRSILVGGNLWGSAAEYSAATSQFVTSGFSEDGYAAIDFALNNYQFRPEATNFIILATDEPRSIDIPALTEQTTLAALQAAEVRLQGIMGAFINNNQGQRALAIDNTNVFTESGATFVVEPGGTVIGGSSVGDYLGLVQATQGITGDLSQIGVSQQTATTFSEALAFSLVGQAGGGTGSLGVAGDWQGITLDPYSHDRNVDTTVENETTIGGTGDLNSTIGGNQRLGELAPDEYSGDENRRLGFTVHGAIADDSDQDMYSFRGTAGSLVWLDIDNTDDNLDSVLEFLDGDGNVLALSDNSRIESINGALTYVNPSDVTTGDVIGFEPGHALPMQLDPVSTVSKTNVLGGGVRDFNSLNDGDAGMRVVLPGTPGTTRTYYVRVRSANESDLSNPTQIDNSLTDGQTKGTYQLSVRLSEADEVSGSIVRHADIRYANVGVRAIGLPSHTPLAGEIFNPGGTIDVGGLSNTDRAAISASGLGATPDTYQFTVGRDNIQGAAGGLGASVDDPKVSAVIDVDFADGLTRPNLGAYLYHNGVLVAVGTDSNVLDDRVSPQIPNQPSVPSILPSGSVGPADPFIGPLELSTLGTYEVTIANNQQVPPEFLQFTDTNAPNTNVRFEPLDSTVRVTDDRFGTAGIPEQIPVAVQVGFEDDGSNVAPYHIGDVPLIAFRENVNGAGAARVSVYNPLTGRHDAIIQNTTSAPISAAAAAARGDIIAIQDNGSQGRNDTNTSTTHRVNPDGSLTALGSTGIQTFRYNFNGAANNPNENVVANVGTVFESLAFYNDTNSQTRFLYGAANRGTFLGISVGTDGNGNDIPGPAEGPINANNLIYRLDPDTGTAISRGGNNMTANFESADPLDPRIQNNFNNFNYPPETPRAGTNIVAQIQIPTISPATGLNTGNIADMVADINGGQFLWVFTDTGAVWQASFTEGSIGTTYDPGDIVGNATLVVDPTLPGAVGGTDFVTDHTGAVLVFDQVTRGPANYQSSDDDIGVSNLYYGLGSPDGIGPQRLYAFNMADRTSQPVFAYGADSIAIDQTGAGGGEFGGLFFSSADQSLWHVSNTNSGLAGHGMPALDNDARPNIGGGNSLRFGFDPLNQSLNHLSAGPFDTTPDASDLQNFVGYEFLGGAHGVVESNSIDLKGMASEDLPTLYFTYLLDTEDANGSARDSLRTYVSGDDGEWSLVATNNFDRDASSNNFDWDTNREYDPDQSNYGDKENDRRYVQQLFDTNEFRQARIDLGPWAGQEDVKIRFEFTTAGEARPDQSEIIALSGDQIEDGHTITISGLMPDRLVDNIGDTIGFQSRTFEFDVLGNGTSGTNIPISISVNDTATQVRDAIQRAIANEIHFADAIPVTGFDFSTNNFPVSGESVKLYDLAVSQSTPGKPLKLIIGQFNGTSNLPVTNFGVYGLDPRATGSTNAQQAALIAAGNRSAGYNDAAGRIFQGVHIDDIVIGLAERGESIGNATNTGAGTLTNNPYFQPTFAGAQRAETTEGHYQVEIRTGREYANPDVQIVGYQEKLDHARVQINERLAEGARLEVTSSGADILDGDIFTLSNGYDTVTFEFNLSGTVTSGNVAIDFNATDTPGEVARAIRDAINTVTINGILGIVATTMGGQLGTATDGDLSTDPNIAIHGYVASDPLGGGDFGFHINGFLTGTDIVRGEDNGDLNRHRDQGQLIIESNQISFSSGFGIEIDAGPTGPSGPLNADNLDEGNRPKPGAVQSLPTLNEQNQIPGAVVQNNLLYDNGGGILVSGDTSVGASSGFSRILNNTIYGSDNAGIEVNQGASPALLNNVVMNNDTGISYASAGEVLIRGTLYQDNANNTDGTPLGTEAVVNSSLEIFLNPAPNGFDFAAGNPNFYPAAGSPVIDASIQNQNDRAHLVSVRDSVGIPPSPIVASTRDLFGQNRDDDPSVNNTSGQGQQITIDRGAIDRSDDQGPTAELLTPRDNDSDGIDVDPIATIVQLSEGRMFQFDVQLVDETGTGIDISTIDSQRISLTENGRLLRAGRDYTLGFSTGSNILRFTPTSGEWRPDSVYVITLNNQSNLQIQALDGDQNSDGDRVTLTDEQGNRSVFEYESGNAIQVPRTFTLQFLGANSSFTDTETFEFFAPDGSSETFELNTTGSVTGGNIPVDLTNAGTIAEVRQAFIDAFSSVAASLDLVLTSIDGDLLQLGVLPGHSIVPASGTAIPGVNIVGTDTGIQEGDTFTYTTPTDSVTFTFTSNPTSPQDIPFSRSHTPEQIAENIATVVAEQTLGLGTALHAGEGVVVLGGSPDDVFSSDTSPLTQIGSAGITGSLTMTVPLGTTDTDLENEIFTVDVGGVSEIFQFTTNATIPIVGTRVLLTAGGTEAEFATAIANALASAFPGQLNSTAVDNVVTVGEQSAIIPDGTVQVRTSIDTSGTDVVQDGITGGAIPIHFFPTCTFSATLVASALASAIELSPLNVTTTRPGGGTLLLNGVSSAQNTTIDGTTPLGTDLQAVSDLAGNPLLPNQISGETQFTIVMPSVRLDFGDAPDSYETTLTNNGARHAIVGPQLGAHTDAESGVVIATGSDDLPLDFDIPAVTSSLMSVNTSLAEPNKFTITLHGPATNGDFVDIEVDGVTHRFEFVSVGNDADAGNEPVPFNPSDNDETLANSLLSAILSSIAETRNGLDAEIDRGDPLDPSDMGAPKTIVLSAPDDEDGVPVGSFSGIAVTPGLFLEESALPDTGIPAQVIAYLNRSDAAGSVIPITVTDSGLLDVWVDLNQDGDFNDLDEQVLVRTPVVGGVNPVRIVIPETSTVGQTWARFRLSTAGSNVPGGLVSDGEVEDYEVSIFDIGAPTLTDDLYTVAEEGTLTVDGLLASTLFDNDVLPTEEFVESRYIIDAVRLGDNDFRTMHGTVTVVDPAAGTFTYVPDDDYFGPDSFRYRVSTQRNDGPEAAANASYATVNINVTPVNDPPVAVGQSLIGLENTGLGDAVLTIPAADLLNGASSTNSPATEAPFDESNQALFITAISTQSGTVDSNNPNGVITTPEGGQLTATFDATGAFILEVNYTPRLHFNRDNNPPNGDPVLDSFNFTLEDDGISILPNGTPVQGTPLSSSATAEIEVTPRNTPPLLRGDYAFVNNQRYQDFYTSISQPAPVPTEDTPLVIPAGFLLGNDLAGPLAAVDEGRFFNNNDGPMAITAVSMVDPSLGSIALTPTGNVLFTPAPNVYGVVEFNYTATDVGISETVDNTRVADPMSTTITSSIFLEPVNDAPVAFDRSLTVDEVAEPDGPAILNFTGTDLVVGSGFNTTSPITTSTTSITVPDGQTMNDGETLTITDASARRQVIEFSTTTTASTGTDVLVVYSPSDTANDIAVRLQNALRANGSGGTASGSVVNFLNPLSIVNNSTSGSVSADATGITVPSGAAILSGEVVAVTDGNGKDLVFEFSKTGVSVNGNIIVSVSDTDAELAVASALEAALISNGIGASAVAGVPGQAIVRFVQSQSIVANAPTSAIGVNGSTLTLADGQYLIDTETVTITDNFGAAQVVEFNTTGIASAGTDIVVRFTVTDTADVLADDLANALASMGAVANGADVAFTQVADSAASVPPSQVTGSPQVINVPQGLALFDGETIDINFISGATIVTEFSTSGIATPGTDLLITYAPFDTATSIATRLQAALSGLGVGATQSGSDINLLSIASIAVGEGPSVPGDFDDTLPSPYNESIQGMRVVAIQADSGSVDADIDGDGTYTLQTVTGGDLTVTFVNGALTVGSYTPPIDYNEQPPFLPNDLFTFTIADDGRTDFLSSSAIRDLDDERSIVPATVTLTVTETNDPPTFDVLSDIDVLEDSGAAGGITVPDVITNPLPGPITAGDENAVQTVSFAIEPTQSNVPAGLMTQLPIIGAAGELTFFPAVDAVGTATYVIRGTDDDGTDPRFTDKTITVNVRPVNDAPRFDPTVLGSGDTDNPDDAYSVGGPANPAITYTLREDNTQPLGATASYFIPLTRDPNIAVGYNRIGLLDVFVAGPANELDSTQGGSQELELFAFPSTTSFGGQLSSVFSGGQLVGLDYVPPLNFNSDFGGFDEFIYTVRDDSTVGGETWDLDARALVPDRLTTDNTVRLQLNAVNDRPEFDLPVNFLEVSEDVALQTFPLFATNINAGPVNSAFDEVDVLNGQNVTFALTSLAFPQSQSAQFFVEYPEISPEGNLTFQPAPDVFGEFEFEVVLTDDGPGNATRGDLISSIPLTLTIDVQPTNDPPVAIDAPLHFELKEDGTVDILVVGDSVTPGMLDVFAPGPPNESANVTPGGNQTIALATPFPATSAQGGTLTPIEDSFGVLNRFRYSPRENFTGMDSFIYTVTDDGVTVAVGNNGVAVEDSRFATSIVTFDVTPVNDAPQFSGATNTDSDEDAGLVSIPNWATNVQAGPITADLEIANQSLTFEITQISDNTELFSTPPSAAIVGNAATLTYVSAPNANGIATFEVRLRDDGPINLDNGDDNLSDTQTFSIRVNAINDPPTFEPGQNITIDEDNGPFNDEWATNISPGPEDELSQSVRFEVVTPLDQQPLFRSLPEIDDDGILKFTTATNANGVVEVFIRAIDSEGGESATTTLTITIDEVNDPPIPASDTIDTDEDTVLTIPSSQLLANDTDPDLQTNPSEVLSVVMPAQSFSLSGAELLFDATTGNLTYDPTVSNALQSLAPGETLVDTFSYNLRDAAGVTSSRVTVSMNVSGINDAPVLVVDNPTLNPSGPTVIAVLENDSDIDGTINPASVTIDLQPSFGSIDIDSEGVITYTPFGSFTTVDQFRYSVADNLGLRSSGALVTISANAAPITLPDAGGTFLDESVIINVSENDTDPDGQLDLNSIIIVDGPLRGEAIPQGDGTVRYVPAPGFIGPDVFQYTIADDEGRRSAPTDVDVRVVASRLQNPDEFSDVNDDGNVSAIDALLIVNRLNIASQGTIPVLETDQGPNYFDVSGDLFVSALDALQVINVLNRRSTSGIEGEQTSDLIRSTETRGNRDTVVDPASEIKLEEKIVDASMPTSVSPDLVDIIAEDRQSDEEERDLGALDAAFGDLL